MSVYVGCFRVRIESENRENVTVSDIAGQLRGYKPKIERTIQLQNEKIDLMTELSIPDTRGEEASGKLEKTAAKKQKFKNISYEIPVSYSADFSFIEKGNSLYLAIFAGSSTANTVAEELEKIISSSSRKFIIDRVRLSSDQIWQIYSSLRAISITYSTIDNIRGGDISKSNLWGTRLQRAQVFKDFRQNGDVTYLMFEVTLFGVRMILSFNEECQISFYEDLKRGDIIAFLRTNILP